jgi:integrase
LFPSSRQQRPLSDNSISKFLREMLASTPWNAVPHGFRSTFTDWARSRTNYPEEVVELSLAHVNTDATRAAYARDELLPRRAKLMQDWARYCNAAPNGAATVTNIRGAK